MRAYISFIKIRFINGLQYRTAAYAGIATQFAWGFMYIMLYQTFYKSNPTKAPMEFSQLSSYIWLQQAFLALFMTWFLDNDILSLITSGNVAYELCRPLDIYKDWVLKCFTFVVPLAFINYYPFLYILGRNKGYDFFYMLSPIIAVLFLIPSYILWRFGVRHYKSTGS